MKKWWVQSTAAEEAIALLALGAGDHKPAHLLPRETVSMLHGDSPSPAVCPDPTAVLSGSSGVGNTPPFQDHLASDNSRSDKRWLAYNTVMVCPLCEKRKAKRDCPAKGMKICSICCGSEREVTIDCPFECRYLQESRQREYKGKLDPKNFPSKEIRIDQSFLRDHAELLNICGRSLLEGASQTLGVVDRDAQEALEALVRTYKTLDSGLYYESWPASSLAQHVVDHLQEKVRKFREEQTRQTGMTQTGDNDVLRTLVFLQRMALDRDNARPRGKAFLDFLRLHFPDPEQPSPGSLIIPGV